MCADDARADVKNGFGASTVHQASVFCNVLDDREALAIDTNDGVLN
jgi:hypothetical protein